MKDQDACVTCFVEITSSYRGHQAVQTCRLGGFCKTTQVSQRLAADVTVGSGI